MRAYSPGGALNGLPTAQGGSVPPTPSAHRLQRGLPGYLILFAPHAFAPQRQGRPSESPSPLVFFQISTHSTATPGIPLASAVLKPDSIQCWSPVKRWEFNTGLNRPPTRPLRPVNPNNACPLRITAAAGTELAGASSAGTVTHRKIASCAFVPTDSGLHSEKLHPARGVARSDFRPLPKPLDCCLP